MAEPTMRPLLSPTEIAVKAEEAGVTKATLPLSRMFVLAVLAGAFIALGGSFMLVVRAVNIVNSPLTTNRFMLGC